MHGKCKASCSTPYLGHFGGRYEKIVENLFNLKSSERHFLSGIFFNKTNTHRFIVKIFILEVYFIP